MAEQMDDIVNRYNKLWVDIKNRNLKVLPKIDFEQINIEATKDMEKKGFSSARTQRKMTEMQQKNFLDIYHKLTYQLHFIRDIKDAGL